MTGDVIGLTRGDTSDYSRSPLILSSGRSRTSIFADDQDSLPSALELVRNTVTRESVFHVETWGNSGVSVAGPTVEAQLSFAAPRGIYRMENGQRIRRFLLNHPQVMRVLAEAQDYVTEYFGADAEVVLEVVEDPDVAQRKKLLARVVTEKPMEEAFSQLQAFGRDWFTSEFARVDGLINFDVACV